eukprot:1159979-Pelagomonas_calceolata.AAC.5
MQAQRLWAWTAGDYDGCQPLADAKTGGKRSKGFISTTLSNSEHLSIKEMTFTFAFSIAMLNIWMAASYSPAATRSG